MPAPPVTIWPVALARRSLAHLGSAAADDEGLYFYRLSLFHEDMHNEAAIYMANNLGFAVPDARPALACAGGSLALAGGIHHLGWHGDGFAFDNELAGRTVAIEPFEIDAARRSATHALPNSSRLADTGGRNSGLRRVGNGWREAAPAPRASGATRVIDGRYPGSERGWISSHPGRPAISPAMRQKPGARGPAAACPPRQNGNTARDHTSGHAMGRCVGMDGKRVRTVSGVQAPSVPRLFRTLVRQPARVAWRLDRHPSAACAIRATAISFPRSATTSSPAFAVARFETAAGSGLRHEHGEPVLFIGPMARRAESRDFQQVREIGDAPLV